MKRGQVALYVLAGLALLIVILLFLLFNRRPEIDNAFAQQQVAPLTDFITTCLESSLEDLLRKAGANGGYLDTSSLRHAPLPSESDTVLFPPQDIPYWSHLKPCDNQLGCEASEQPPLCREGAASCPLQSFGEESVQEQLEAALPAVVDRCLNNFAAFETTYLITRDAAATAEVIFTENVIATLEMPVTITNIDTGSSLVITEFVARAPLNLAELYTLAHDMANAERETAFLEQLTLHLLAIYADVDGPLPPMRSLSLLGQKQYWTRTQVEQLLRDEILPWANFIQVPNALAGFTPIAPSAADATTLSPEEQTMYSGIFYYLYVKPNDQIYDDLKVRFFYPYTRPYLSINGGQEVLKPRSAEVGGLLSKMVGVFINDYRFRYDITYPVIITLSDTAAFDGRGYDWSFALEANIRDNQPVNRSGTVSNFLLTEQRVDFSTPAQRVDNTIRIQTLDRRSNEKLPGTRISYRCGEEYYIAETDANGQLVTQLPYCRYGGVLLYSKAGYLGSGQEYDNYQEGITRDFTFALWPLQNVTLSMEKRTSEQIATLTGVAATYTMLRQESSPLNSSDLVMLNIERIKESPYDEDVPLGGFFTFSKELQRFSVDLTAKEAELRRLEGEGVLTAADVTRYLDALSREQETLLAEQPTATALLAPGKYRVESFLLHNEQFTIPEETREFCTVDVIFCLDKEEMTLPETNFSSWLSGGAHLEERPWELPANILYSHDEYTLYALEQALPSNWHDLEEYRTPEEWLTGKELLQIPTFQ